MLKGGETEIPTSPSNLRIKIFIIGYKNQGESIVILFVDISDKKRPVKYSIVIDCFRYSKQNITDEILRHYSVDTLSMLCWTHPDLDHSVGIDLLIKKYCKESTQILLPEHFYNEPNDIVTINNKDLRDAVDKIFSLNRLKRKAVSNISVTGRGYNEIKSLKFTGVDKSIIASVNAVTPISSILTEYVKKGKRDINKNELSISFILNIDEYYLYFGGDAMNRHIDAINPFFLEQCRFVKIPHHSSDTSKNLIDYLPSQIDTACTTIFSTHNLPKEMVWQKYCSMGRVFSTGGNNNKKYNYGVIEYEYDFSKEEVDMSIRLHGNAIELK
ncbi:MULTISPECIES: hypothetical protein [Bacteroides]|uniref:hypothetical protein n=1 Tax=Bacteroides TaxID=816 RepID=UPI001CDBDCB7|nr:MULTISPECIES: hypothetical protein [Bacteroides]MCA4454653.1 hypothetical protein [Bacteroides xylanisolvens]MCA4459590.1 hypothetical protein [Bacteroides xylanisolvens]MCA4473183.1 hypothetical protein [Bacteroides xylanisolvens]MCA4482198.1 hypothetical protein [Bacteroides xylanisolvens]MCA4527115.1 hypothetical protein [Bacteroides ovatus]